MLAVVGSAEPFTTSDLAARVAEIERIDAPRWVWADTARIYPKLLDAGVSVERSTDLRMCHRILRHARATASSELAAAPASVWDEEPSILSEDTAPTLLDELSPSQSVALSIDDLVDEHERQQRAIESAPNPAALRLLLAAESVGALIAAEIGHIGLPWSAEIHDRQLVAELGPRPVRGERPAALERLAAEIQHHLGAPELNPDSPAELLRSLKLAGLPVKTTRKWEIAELRHPVREPLLEYKRLARLHAANGWSWLDTWVRDGRFHPDYVPAGVVTGRWATRGGGALQLPKSLRAAVVADPGWRLVVADAAQLEPRVLAAMSGDPAMAAAGRGVDMYQALVDQRVVATRQQAKIGMLAAMYGGTTGEAGELLGRLRRAFPAALALVDEAARAGERFEQVTTWLGRTSPRPGGRWITTQQQALGDDASASDEQRARSEARDWGRFTRNFVVQGTAAEWALCWMGALRRRLRGMGRSGSAPELVYFLHDELIVHAPDDLANDVAAALQSAAEEAARLMFGVTDVEFALTIDVVSSYDQSH